MEENKEQKLKDDVVKNTDNKASKKESGKSGLAVTALVLSIIALPFSFIPIINIIGLILGIVAAILGVVAVIMKQKKVLSLIAIGFAVLAIIITLIAGAIVSKYVSNVTNIFKDAAESITDTKDKIDNGINEFQNSTNPKEVVDDTTDSGAQISDDVLEDETKNAWEADFDVEIKELDVVEEEYTHTSKLEVIVTNKSKDKKTLQIKIDAMSPEGYRVNYDSSYIYDLMPGQKQKIELFKYISRNQLEEMKKASFEVSEITVY